MPIYEYECNACGSRFERRQRVSDDPVRECPACGGQTRRVLHPVGVIFKGSGFYLTDNRKPESSSNGSSSSSSTSTTTAAATSSSSTAAATSASKSTPGSK